MRPKLSFFGQREVAFWAICGATRHFSLSISCLFGQERGLGEPNNKQHTKQLVVVVVRNGTLC